MIARRSLLILALGAPGASLVGCSPATSDTLDVEAFAKLVATPGVVVLDVRTPQEYADGHLKGALLLDVNAPDFAAKVAQLDKAASYAVYCRSGNRSATALKIMKDAGIKQVAHLGQGITAWTKAGQPVVR